MLKLCFKSSACVLDIRPSPQLVCCHYNNHHIRALFYFLLLNHVYDANKLEDFNNEHNRDHCALFTHTRIALRSTFCPNINDKRINYYLCFEDINKDAYLRFKSIFHKADKDGIIAIWERGRGLETLDHLIAFVYAIEIFLQHFSVSLDIQD